MEEEIDSVVKDMHNNMLKVEKKKMPEKVFKEFFLPYFNGNEKISEDSSIMAKWVEFSGSVYNKVDLIDANGKVVSEVPPIIDNNDLNRDNSDNIDYSTITSEFNLRSKRSPISGEAYLDKTLDNVSDALVTGKSENKKEWITLLNKYSDKKEIKITIEKDDDLIDMIDYD